MFHVRTGRRYLGYDSRGNHEWVPAMLDAIRFETRQEAATCCGPFVNTGALIRPADRWDGHYETYRGHEIQIFRDKMRGKPGGKRWRYRFGTLDHSRPYEYSGGNLGYTTPENALKAAIQAVRKRAVALV